jgi:hypothetical protein
MAGMKTKAASLQWGFILARAMHKLRSPRSAEVILYL